MTLPIAGPGYGHQPCVGPCYRAVKNTVFFIASSSVVVASLASGVVGQIMEQSNADGAAVALAAVIKFVTVTVGWFGPHFLVLPLIFHCLTVYITEVLNTTVP